MKRFTVDKKDIIVLLEPIFDETIKSKKWSANFINTKNRYIVVDTPTNNGTFHGKDIHGKIHSFHECDIANNIVEYIPSAYSRNVMHREAFKGVRS